MSNEMENLQVELVLDEFLNFVDSSVRNNASNYSEADRDAMMTFLQMAKTLFVAQRGVDFLMQDLMKRQFHFEDGDQGGESE